MKDKLFIEHVKPFKTKSYITYTILFVTISFLECSSSQSNQIVRQLRKGE